MIVTDFSDIEEKSVTIMAVAVCARPPDRIARSGRPRPAGYPAMCDLDKPTLTRKCLRATLLHAT
jgi:hypothetical protein